MSHITLPQGNFGKEEKQVKLYQTKYWVSINNTTMYRQQVTHKANLIQINLKFDIKELYTKLFKCIPRCCFITLFEK